MNLFALSQRIRELRRQRGMTLEQLANATSLTQSLLSKVENFRVTPSLPALGRIAAALGIPLSALVEGLDSSQPFVIIRRRERLRVERDRPRSSIDYYALAQERPAKSMNPFILHVPPGEPRKEPLPHEGEEFLLVLQGRVQLEYEDNRYTLESGDGAYFDASQPHRLINPAESAAEVLCVFSDPGASTAEI